MWFPLFLWHAATTHAETLENNHLYRHLLKQAEPLLVNRARQVAALSDPASLEARSRWVSQTMIEAVGGLPERTPLNARTVWSKEFGDHRIEGVIFESRSGIHVTANLYLPTSGQGPYPAILGPCGHSAEGKAGPAYQPAWINLARRGFVVLSFDPLGQGERMNFLDQDGKHRYWGTTEHTMLSVQSLLLGYSIAREFIWDGMRAIDYLETRPEVDSTRIGCTGNSGGGTQTAYFMAVDERIKCAAPSCYITSLTRLFETIGPQDGEQNLVGQVALGIDHADYIEACLPNPVLICCASDDFFDIEGTWNTFREAKGYYGRYGYPERVDIFEAPDGHGFSAPRRTAVYHWMARWLKGETDEVPEPPTDLKEVKDLLCTETGQVLTSLPGARSYAQIYAEEAAALRERRRSQKIAEGDSGWIEALVERAAIRRPEKKPWRQLPKKQSQDSLVVHSFAAEMEPRWTVPLLLYEPLTGSEAGPVLWLEDALRQTSKYAESPGDLALKQRRSVVALASRGLGKQERMKGNALYQYFGDWTSAFLAMHIGRPLLGQRVEDILAALDFVKERYPGQPVTVVANREAVPPAIVATLLNPDVGELILQEGLSTWERVFTARHSSDVFTNVVPGILEIGDIPDLVKGILPRKVTLLSARSPEGEPLPREAIEEDYRWVIEKAALLGTDSFRILAD